MSTQEAHVKISKFQPVKFRLPELENVLDITWAITYHTRACARGLTAHAGKSRPWRKVTPRS